MKNIGICYAITIITFAVFAFILTYLPVPEEVVPAVVLIITILSIIMSGIMTAKKAKSKGWIRGAVSGSIYILTLYLIGSLLFQSFCIGTGFITMLIIGMLSGAFGGIIGVNIK